MTVMFKNKNWVYLKEQCSCDKSFARWSEMAGDQEAWK